MKTWIQEHSEVLVSAILLALLATCVEPLMSIMPAVWDGVVLVFIIAAFGLYAGIIYRERPRDERERLHLSRAERAGFLVGTTLLVLFITLDIAGAAPEKGLVWVLGAMILTKLTWFIIAKLRS